MKKLFSIFAVVAMVLTLSPQSASALTSYSQLQAGDLIRGESFSAVYYYGKDGFRYVFPNDKTYFTWYDNFDNVKFLSDADLAQIQIGGNATYRPGIRMIKINSDPKTYAVGEGGSLHWVTSESVAISLYGSAWNTMIDDVPDAFFSNYQKGADIEEADDFDPANETSSATDINNDKDLKFPTVVNISDDMYDQETVTINAGTVVKWTNNGTNKHTATADNLKWGTGTLQNSQSFSRYFDTPGTYTYFCSYHPDTMHGTLIVQ
ncbi:cupredoxin domain-containing protein [Patescibacteria group bacterium]